MAAKKKGKRKPRFRVGQVVAIRYSDICIGGSFGKIGAFSSGRVIVYFHDHENSDYFEWEHDPSDLRPLTARERGKP